MIRIEELQNEVQSQLEVEAIEYANERTDFKLNDLSLILDAIYSCFENEADIALISDNENSSKCRILATQIDAKVVLSNDVTIPKNVGVVIMLASKASRRLLRFICENEIPLIILEKECVRGIFNLNNSELLQLPKYSDNKSENFEVNLRTLPVAINSVKKRYYQNVNEELVRLTSILSDVNIRASAALDEALVELQKTKKLLEI